MHLVAKLFYRGAMNATQHVPVMLSEILHWLAPRSGQRIVDGTVGGGGHAAALLQAVGPSGTVIGLDRDPAALDRVRQAGTTQRVQLVHGNFRDLPEVLAQDGMDAVDAILLDLGLSSDQLADAERGFSFHATGPLDLRFDKTRGEPAWRLLNRLSSEHLANLIYEFGEERRSRRIARALVEARRKGPFRDANQIAETIRRAVPKTRDSRRIHPATRTFQALRIATNEELKSLQIALNRLPDCLVPGGRIAIISFHSLEDRIVKHAFQGDERLKVLTKKPIVPSPEEVQENPRSRSSKLRVAERVDPVAQKFA